MGKLIIANWKENPRAYKIAEKLFRETAKGVKKSKKTKVVICPPSVYLRDLSKLGKKLNSRILLGAQNLYFEEIGAYTGEISAPMIKDSGGAYVIIGHSERRGHFNENDEDIRKKIRSAIKYGLKPVLCVGEKKRDRDGTYFRFIKREIILSLKGLKVNQLSGLVMAYEPIWAIGSGRAQSAKDSAEMAVFIEKNLSDLFTRNIADKIPIIYGGSVSPENAINYLSKSRINGLLVGGQSLKSKNFMQIINLANNAKA